MLRTSRGDSGDFMCIKMAWVVWGWMEEQHDGVMWNMRNGPRLSDLGVRRTLAPANDFLFFLYPPANCGKNLPHLVLDVKDDLKLA